MSVGFVAPMISPAPEATYTAPSPVDVAPAGDVADAVRSSQHAAAPAPDLLPVGVPAADSRPDIQPWTRVIVSKGDNLASIFSRLGFDAGTLDAVMDSTEAASRLSRLQPGQTLEFKMDGDELQALRFESSLDDALEIERINDGFVGSVVAPEIDKRLRLSEGEIHSSLFTDGQNAGLSDRLIMDMAAIFGWDIDFAMDIWEGDHFKVLYEEYYRDGARAADGPILAAEFSNRGKVYRAVRYTMPDGQTGYYSETGASMRKAFLRTPLKFTRISSGFSLRRFHPILNLIRAHRGVDYAAPVGTEVRATGDGIVAFEGTRGGYGNTIVLRHGAAYSTVYAHLSRFASGLKSGSRVHQGDVIGYVGMTGLATGPHLHYEFQINGVHHDPLTIALPHAEGIPSNQVHDFESATAPLLARLDEGEETGAGMVAAGDRATPEPAAR